MVSLLSSNKKGDPEKLNAVTRSLSWVCMVFIYEQQAMS